MRRSIVRTVAAAALAASMVAPPASAQFVFAGTCVVSGQFTFGSPVNLTSAATSAMIDFAGTCIDNAGLPFVISHGITTSGGGSSTLTTCGTMMTGGGFSTVFGGDVPPPSASGSMRYEGTISAGSLILLGTASTGGTFAAQGTLVGTNPAEATACATTTPGKGTLRMSFSGVLTFSDP